MPKPFTCPYCGAHDYVIVLTGCKVEGATIEEAFTWDPVSATYDSTGPVILDSQNLENAGGQALCANCDKDVSQAVSAYETAVQAESAQA